MSRHTDGTLTSFDGLSLFHQAWLPDDPKAIVMIVHGLGEHSGRYAHVAERLVAAGYGAHAIDHRGHGRSDGKRAYVKSYDEFMADMVQFRAHIETAHPGVPLFVLGHSMGGAIAMSHVLDHQDGVAGLALSGAALKPGDDFSPTQIKIFALIAKVAPGFKPQGLSADSISRDPAVVAAYQADPLVYNGKIPAGLGAALFAAMATFPDRYPSLRVPTLVMHGTDDRLTNIEGSREVERLATNTTVTAHYYEGLYHEIFNEPEQETVLDDVVAWLDRIAA